MAHHLHVDTAVLRAVRHSAGGVQAGLRADALDPQALAVLAAVPGGAALVAEHDRLLAAVFRTAHELAELDAALSAAAMALETAERHAVRAMTGGER